MRRYSQPFTAEWARERLQYEPESGEEYDPANPFGID